jgi:bifunctional non-homologous end joining protein LigD
MAKDALQPYRAKRDFTKTDEPAGADDTAPARQALAFVIQKHAASRLHFDLRLECDGVMLSWAVPKGPSLDPAVKRLAMHVEDHPLEYNTFEGTIPKGEYGGGTVMLWDRGTYGPMEPKPGERPEAAVRRGLAKGKLDIVISGERLKGTFSLVRTNEPQWLLIKRSDESAMPAFDPVATHVTSIETGRTMEEIAAGGEARSTRAGAPPVRALRTRQTSRIPSRGAACTVRAGAVELQLTNLHKPFWPATDSHPALTKGDLLRYYEAVAPVLVPHLRHRAMVMKRFPNGALGEHFFMKRTPENRPDWLETCPITHASGSLIEFPVVQDLASLLWVVNLGCIDLNPWYAWCDDVDRPDVLHFDLDPGPGADFAQVREVALRLKELLDLLEWPSYPKTTGSRGMHVYVPIVRGPVQKGVWTIAKSIAQEMEARHPQLVTAEYRIAKRPHGRVLVDYNQNAWGRTLSSVYSVRPRPEATVSMPVTWTEVEQGITLEQFTVRTVPEQLAERGDLWWPLLRARGRANLELLGIALAA